MMNVAWNRGLCVRELGELRLSRKSELEFGLYSIGHRDPLKVLKQETDLAKASLGSLSWQSGPGRSQESIQVVVGGVQV